MSGNISKFLKSESPLGLREATQRDTMDTSGAVPAARVEAKVGLDLGRPPQSVPSPLHVCRKCGQSVPLVGNQCPTPGCRAALPHNTLTVRDGARSSRSGAELYPALADMLCEREAAIFSDLGGAEEVSTTKRELIVRFVQASAIADQLAGQIVQGGVTSAKGRPRAAVSLYLQVIDRVHRLAVAIGLERQSRPVHPLDAVRAAVAEAANRL